jgi:RNA recognition motif-containing protein
MRNMEGKRIFVSNLSYETQWKYLKDHMRQGGDVVRADIFEDESGRSRGMGYVSFTILTIAVSLV